MTDQAETPKDYLIEDVARQAAARRKVLFPFMVYTYQKWTCKHCSSRQTMAEANRWFRSGTCEECKQVTIITHCNYLMHIKRPGL